jgi:hypothetical protein
MQIEVRKSEAKVEREYPYIGETKDPFKHVLFFSKNNGVVIKSDDEDLNPIGYIPESGWREICFTPIAKVTKLIIETE